jgi:hypothetical protein
MPAKLKAIAVKEHQEQMSALPFAQMRNLMHVITKESSFTLDEMLTTLQAFASATQHEFPQDERFGDRLMQCACHLVYVYCMEQTGQEVIAE